MRENEGALCYLFYACPKCQFDFTLDLASDLLNFSVISRLGKVLKSFSDAKRQCSHGFFLRSLTITLLTS